MTATFLIGDVLETLAKLPEKSVDLVLSSPPFLALRSYLPADHPDKAKEGGSQATPGAYIDWLIDVVEACARVLAPHGSLCFELGDTYAGSGGAGGDYNQNGLREGQLAFAGSGKLANYNDARGNPDGMRDTTFSGGNTRTGGGTGWPLAKSLSLIPELFRFTLVYGFNPLTGRQTDRWRLRNVIRWVRPNPPVGALGDKFRPATSELMVFCKSGKRFFDLDAVRTEFLHPEQNGRNLARGGPTFGEKGPNLDRGDLGAGNFGSSTAGAPPLDWWEISLLDGEEKPYGPKPRDITKGIPNKALAHSPTKGNSWGDDETKIMYENPNGAPPLDWWNIPPGGYEGAHYAVWPPELCVKPIKAMCPEKVCRTCGEPRRRIVESERLITSPPRESNGARITGGEFGQGGVTTYDTLGFSDCGHDNYRPGVVLDPFAGSGTTLAVATGHGRDAIGIDLDARNFDLALERVGPMFLQRGEVAV